MKITQLVTCTCPDERLQPQRPTSTLSNPGVLSTLLILVLILALFTSFLTDCFSAGVICIYVCFLFVNTLVDKESFDQDVELVLIHFVLYCYELLVHDLVTQVARFWSEVQSWPSTNQDEEALIG